MKSVRLDYPLGLLCRVFDVSRSGFYVALERQPSQRAQDDERLKVAIKAAHVQTRETYGPAQQLQETPAASGPLPAQHESQGQVQQQLEAFFGCGDSSPDFLKIYCSTGPNSSHIALMLCITSTSAQKDSAKHPHLPAMGAGW
jgi:hypothetical protein